MLWPGSLRSKVGRVRGDLFNHQAEDRDIRIKSISRVRGFWRKVRAALHLTGGSYGEKAIDRDRPKSKQATQREKIVACRLKSTGDRIR